MLTGESEEVRKVLTVGEDEPFAKNMCFMGTEITNGRGKAIVTSTGQKTEMGTIDDQIQKAKEYGNKLTPLQMALNRLGALIGAMVWVGLISMLRWPQKGTLVTTLLMRQVSPTNQFSPTNQLSFTSQLSPTNQLSTTNQLSPNSQLSPMNQISPTNQSSPTTR